jgi:circadian clock protein KaiB
MGSDDTHGATQDADRTPEGHYVLRLYVTGMTHHSMQAIENTRRLCEDHLQGRYELEIVDIYQQPEAAQAAQLVAAPTMIKLLPLPLRRFVGDMSDEEKILVGLDLRFEASGDKG